jgi:hypothetical protein
MAISFPFSGQMDNGKSSFTRDLDFLKGQKKKLGYFIQIIIGEDKFKKK